MTKIAIVHFQPVELYPPVMNIINSITELENIACDVYTTKYKNNNWFSADKIKINRLANQYKKFFLRYWCYVQYNILTFLSLVLKQPKIIIAYEAYSLLPVYVYKKLFPKSKIFIHYHEYISPNEIKNSSFYFKMLHFFEKKLFLICDYISQTNDDRLQLFLNDYPQININQTFVIPNLPPNKWIQFSKLNKKENKTGIIKLVHVGAIGLNTMYIEEIIDWVVNQNGKYTIDFYSNNISNGAQILFDNLKNKDVRLLDAINYFELPKILINYDIGVTLYNGHIPNYVYNVPNKVFEYLGCGLAVWYSIDLISTDRLNKKTYKNTEISEIPIFLRKLDYEYNNSNKNLLISQIIQYL